MHINTLCIRSEKYLNNESGDVCVGMTQG